MHIRPRLLLALGVAAFLAGCDGASSGKVAKTSEKAELILKIAHVTESGGDFASAERSYRQAAAMDEKALEPHIELAEFYYRHHRDTEAIAALTDALKLDPKNAGIMRELANIYIHDGMPDKAVALLNDAIALDPKNPMLFNSRGVASDMLGNVAAAQQSYRSALALDPGNAMTFDANLSMSYILSGDINAAIALLTPLLDRPDATPTIRQNLAMAYGIKGENGKALKLSLKDMPMEQARENLKFYHMIAGRHGGKKPLASSLPAPTAPVSTVNELFPTEEPPPEPAPAPAKPVSMRNAAPGARTTPVLPEKQEAGMDIVPSPEIKILPPSAPSRHKDYSGGPDASLPAASPSAGWVLPTPVLKPVE